MFCFSESVCWVEAHRKIFVNFNLGAPCEKLSMAFGRVKTEECQGNLKFEWYRGIIRLICMRRFFVLSE